MKIVRERLTAELLVRLAGPSEVALPLAGAFLLVLVVFFSALEVRLGGARFFMA